VNNIELLVLIFSLELNPTETMFLARLADDALEDGSEIQIPAKRLARDCRLSICSVRRLLAKWRARGVLIVARKSIPGRPRQYTLNLSELEAIRRRAREKREAQILRLVMARDAHSGRTRRATFTTEKSGWLETYHATSAKSQKETNGRAQRRDNGTFRRDSATSAAIAAKPHAVRSVLSRARQCTADESDAGSLLPASANGRHDPTAGNLAAAG
jgi:hypothetical protein